MTEICAAFCGKLDDTLEQTTATLGYILEHVEVRKSKIKNLRVQIKDYLN